MLAGRKGVALRLSHVGDVRFGQTRLGFLDGCLGKIEAYNPMAIQAEQFRSVDSGTASDVQHAQAVRESLHDSGDFGIGNFKIGAGFHAARFASEVVAADRATSPYFRMWPGGVGRKTLTSALIGLQATRLGWRSSYMSSRGRPAVDGWVSIRVGCGSSGYRSYAPERQVGLEYAGWPIPFRQYP